ncbi:hypothetical protein ACVBEF_18355 [Glaciimonas sp. GG7]
MRTGKEGWRKIPPAQREQAIKDALTEGIVKQAPDLVRLFGTVIKKSAVVSKYPHSPRGIRTTSVQLPL